MSLSPAFSIQSGEGGTGVVLATGSVLDNYNQGSGDPTGELNKFDLVSVTFDGVAKSILFNNDVSDAVGFDNMLFGDLVAVVRKPYVSNHFNL